MSRIKRLINGLGWTWLRCMILGLIWVDMHYFNINEYFAIGVTAVWIIALRFLQKRVSNLPDFSKINSAWKSAGWDGAGYTIQRILGTVFYAALDLIIVLYMVAATLLNPYWNSESYRENSSYEENSPETVSRKDALADYDFMMKYLKKVHPLTLGGLPTDMETRAKEVREWIEGQESVEGAALAREFESILSLLRDGHTMVEENYATIHYMKYKYEHDKAGHTLVGINGVRFEEFLAQHPLLVSYETESYGVRMLKNYVAFQEGLRYLGVDISKEIEYNYVTEDGKALSEIVSADDFLLRDEYVAYVGGLTGDDSNKGVDRGFVYYDIDEEHSLAVLTLNASRNDKVYKDTLKEMFDEVYAKGIENVCVDLRANSGGDSGVANEFISYLDVDSYVDWSEELRLGCYVRKGTGAERKNVKKDRTFSGKVYVLTGVRTYSAAMDFTMLILDNHLGTVIGQPCGNLPGSYGQVACFRLPKTGFYMQISMKKWYRVDLSKNDQPLMPDIECPEGKALEVLIENL